MQAKKKIKEFVPFIAVAALCVVTLFVPVLFFVSVFGVVIFSSYICLKKGWLYIGYLVGILALVCIGGSGDFVLVLFSVLSVSGVVGVILGFKQRSYLHGAALAAIICISGALIFGSLGFIINDKKPSDFCFEYVEQKLEKNDTCFRALTAIYYWQYEDEYGEKLTKTDEGFEQEREKVFKKRAWDFGENEMFFFLMSAGSILGITAFIAALMLVRDKHNAPNLCDMRLDKRFLFFVFVPAFLFSLLGYVLALRQIAFSVFFSIALVPSAFCAFTLIIHTIYRIKNTATKRTFCTFCAILFVLSLFIPSVLIVVSFVGVADMILNIRSWLDYSLKQD